MSYTFLNMQDKLSSLLGDDNSDTTDQFPLADRKKELNRGEMRFCLESKMVREYATSTVASMEISLPSDCLEVFAFYIVSGNQKWKISNDREISVRDLERYAAYNGDIPFYYIFQDDGTRKIKLVGSTANNGRTYQIFYTKKQATELSGDSDVSIIPEEFREGPCYYAAAQLLRQIGKTELAAEFMNEYYVLVRLAQEQAEQLFQNYEFPRPDFNIADITVQDVQGGGWGLT
jgi:hypothetical protein